VLLGHSVACRIKLVSRSVSTLQRRAQLLTARITQLDFLATLRQWCLFLRNRLIASLLLRKCLCRLQVVLYEGHSLVNNLEVAENSGLSQDRSQHILQIAFLAGALDERFLGA